MNGKGRGKGQAKKFIKDNGTKIAIGVIVAIVLILGLNLARADQDHSCQGGHNCNVDGGGGGARGGDGGQGGAGGNSDVSGSGGSVNWQNDFEDFPVDSAAIRYAGDCQAVMNAQGRNFGVGIGSRDRVCQWLSLAQARHLEAAALICAPSTGKSAPDASCMQRRAVLWAEGDALLDRAEEEMDRAGILKKGWRLLF